MNHNLENIQKLRTLIYNSLSPLVDRDFVLLDIPNHANIGDTLIWEGELTFLTSLPYKMLYSANHYTCQLSKVPENAVIFLHGGGNFGDLWRNSQEFRNRIVAGFPNHKIIIFPQTVYYKDGSLLKRDAAIFGGHPDLTICARDEISYGFLKEHFVKNEIVLLPDMAFCLDFGDYHTSEMTGKTLILKRIDRELASSPVLEDLIASLEKDLNDVEIKDWPTLFKKTTLKGRFQGIISRGEFELSKRIKNQPLLSKMVNDVYGMKFWASRKELIKKGIDFINQYDEVYTTRLHGYILALLLNKKVTMLDNSYSKNKNFYETWIKNFSNSTLLV